MPTKITNIAGNPATLPPPFNRVLKAGASVQVAENVKVVIAALGGEVAIQNTLDVADASGGSSDALAHGEYCRMYPITVPAKGTNNVHAAYAGNAAVAFPGPITNPDVPRNLRAVFAASYDGGDIVVDGTDQFGNTIQETIVAVANSTVVGAKVFKTVTAIRRTAVGATANTVSIGTGDKIGVPFKLKSAVGVLLVAATAEAVTVDVTLNSFVPTTVPAGTAFIFLGSVGMS